MSNDIILKDIPDKREDKNTTSLVMKKDLIDFFEDKYSTKKCFEIGTNNGYTTRMLSFLFESVKTIESNIDLIDFAKKINQDRNNIDYVHGDAYSINNEVKSNNWWLNNDEISLMESNEKFDVFFIDCVHDEEHVLMDIDTALKDGTDEVILVFDDYGLPEDKPSVKVAVDKCLENGLLKFITHIGEPAGNEPRRGRPLIDWEGIICQRA
jgi:SAM-dependent methyltransferase